MFMSTNFFLGLKIISVLCSKSCSRENYSRVKKCLLVRKIFVGLLGRSVPQQGHIMPQQSSPYPWAKNLSGAFSLAEIATAKPAAGSPPRAINVGSESWRKPPFLPSIGIPIFRNLSP
jgi:hypothetical protein